MTNELQTKLDLILQDKETNLIPEHLKAGVTCLGVEGILEEGGPGEVKLFESTEALYNDENPQEGDLAIVYKSEIQSANADTVFNSIIFPDTVVLPEAVTDYIYVTARAVDTSVMCDFWGNLSSSRFSINCYTDSGSINIEYESTDGITYTRIDTFGNPVEFPTDLYFDTEYEPFNDLIGYFMQINGAVFNGLYQYKTFKNKNKIHAYSYSELTWDNSTRKLTGTGGEVIEFDIESTLNKITEYTKTNFSDYRSGTYYDDPVYEYMLYYDNNCIVFPFATQNEETPYKFLHNLNLLIDNTTWKAAGGIITTSTSCTYNLHEIRVDMTTGEISYELLEEGFTNQGYEFLTRFNNYKFVGNINMDGTFNYEYQRNMLAILYYDVEDSKWYSSNCIYGEKPGVDDIRYLFADTQFTLKNSNELLPGKVAYGKNGEVTGDESIYSNILPNVINQEILKVQLANDEAGNSLASIRGPEITTQHMVSYVPNTKGSNYVYYSELESWANDTNLSGKVVIKYDDDTLITIKQLDTTSPMVAYKYVVSTNTTTELCSLEGSRQSYNTAYYKADIDENKENIYFSGTGYENSKYYLDIYKLDLVNMTLSKIANFSNSSSAELSSTSCTIISAKHQATLMDTKTGVKRFNFDGTSSTIISKTTEQNHYNTSGWYSHRYLPVLVDTTVSGKLDIFDIETLALTSISLDSKNTPVSFDKDGTTYIFKDYKLYIVNDGVLTLTKDLFPETYTRVDNIFPYNEPWFYNDMTFISAGYNYVYTFNIKNYEVEELDTDIIGAGLLLDKKDKDYKVYYRGSGIYYYKHIDLLPDNSGYLFAFRAGTLGYNELKMTLRDYNYLAEHKDLPRFNEEGPQILNAEIFTDLLNNYTGTLNQAHDTDYTGLGEVGLNANELATDYENTESLVDFGFVTKSETMTSGDSVQVIPIMVVNEENAAILNHNYVEWYYDNGSGGSYSAAINPSWKLLGKCGTDYVYTSDTWAWMPTSLKTDLSIVNKLKFETQEMM